MDNKLYRVGHIYLFVDRDCYREHLFWTYKKNCNNEYLDELKTHVCNLYKPPALINKSSLYILEKFCFKTDDKQVIFARTDQWRNIILHKHIHIEHVLPDIPNKLIEYGKEYIYYSRATQATLDITDIYLNEKQKNTNVENPSITKKSTKPFKASIYTIYNPQEHKYYIGSTTETIQRRFEKHRCLPVPKMKHLKDIFNKLELKLIEEDVYNNPDDLELREDYYMVVYNCVDNGYNSRYNKCHSTCPTKLQEYKKKLQRKHGLKCESDDDNDDIDYKELYNHLRNEHNKLKDKYDKLLINYNKLAPK